MSDQFETAPIKVAKELLAGAGLRFPYVPPEMQPGFEQLAEWTYSTRLDFPDPYNLMAYLEEWVTHPVGNYLVLAQAGHGTNSWALHYYLVRGPLALFLQSGWGGAYMDKETTQEKINLIFSEAEKLILAVKLAEESGYLQPSQRLAVVVSDFFAEKWQFFEEPLTLATFEGFDSWRVGRNVLLDALKFVNQLG